MSPAQRATLRVQSVLYRSKFVQLKRVVDSLFASASFAGRAGRLTALQIAFGDCSPEPVIDESQIIELRLQLPAHCSLEYRFFGKNLGHGGGQNELFSKAEADLLLVLNPDATVAPNLFEELISALDDPDVGLAEARQLPIEHPKEYDVASGETPWATGACLMCRANTFRELGGFDSETFYMYCDDVDLSWRARLAGHKVVLRPTAAVYHPKRLSLDAGMMPTQAERRYSAEAHLLLAHKYSRPDILARDIDAFSRSGDPDRRRAVEEFGRRRSEGRLPAPIDVDHQVGFFMGQAYAEHRFVL